MTRIDASLRALPSVALRGMMLLAMLSLPVTGCAPDQILGAAKLPPEVDDPATTHTAHGALLAYQAGITYFNRNVFHLSVLQNGILSDELQSVVIGAPLGTLFADMDLDSRSRDEDFGGISTYVILQGSRTQSREGAGLALEHRPGDGRALAGHLKALEGYAEIFLADFYCSGVPLSTVDYGGDWTLKPGSSTDEIYQHAVVLLDSAVMLAADSSRFLNLARVGKARALLGFGNYAEAAGAAAQVPDGFAYLSAYITPNVFVMPFGNWSRGTVADREGGNGLDYRSSDDPRTRSIATSPNRYGQPMYFPEKYFPEMNDPTKFNNGGTTPIVLADWIEARLIEAEAALQANDVPGWLAKLNHLRRTAITPALADTTDPGTQDARIDLLFRERAFWLFLTGHRVGDMRRLVRQYGRDTEKVFPTGPYPGGHGVYGSRVSVAPPPLEAELNPHYDGCLSTGA